MTSFHSCSICQARFSTTQIQLLALQVVNAQIQPHMYMYPQIQPYLHPQIQPQIQPHFELLKKETLLSIELFSSWVVWYLCYSPMLITYDYHTNS